MVIGTKKPGLRLQIAGFSSMMATFHQVMTKGQSCDPALCDLAIHRDSTHISTKHERWNFNMWNNPPIVFLGFSHVDICRRHSWYSVLSIGLVGLVGLGICGSISMNFNQRIDIVGVQFCNVSGDQKI